MNRLSCRNPRHVMIEVVLDDHPNKDIPDVLIYLIYLMNRTKVYIQAIYISTLATFTKYVSSAAVVIQIIFKFQLPKILVLQTRITMKIRENNNRVVIYSWILIMWCQHPYKLQSFSVPVLENERVKNDVKVSWGKNVKRIKVKIDDVLFLTCETAWKRTLSVWHWVSKTKTETLRQLVGKLLIKPDSNPFSKRSL